MNRLSAERRDHGLCLAACPDYTLDAWKTGANGIMVRPTTPEGVREQLKKLRYPFLTGGAGA